MIKKLKISLNVLLSIFIIISLAFSATLIGISVYKQNYVYSSLNSEVEEDSANVDNYLFDVFYNVALYKNSIFNTNNLNDFKNAPDKAAYLLDLEAENRLNQDLYFDVALVYAGDYFPVYNQAFHLDTNSLNKMNVDDKLVIVDKFNYEDEFTLVIGVKNLDIYSIFYLRESAISNFLSLSYDNSMRLIVHDDQVLISTNNNVIDLSISNLNLDKNNVVINGTKYVAIKNALSSSSYFQADLYAINLIDYQSIFALIDFIQILLIVFLIIVSSLVFITSFVMVKKIVRPINALSKEMATLDLNKNYSPQNYDGKETNEIYMLEKSYQNMIYRIQDLMKRQQEDNETQRQLELDSLQMQVNPHFLYNSLDMISWMSKLSNNKNIEEFVILLARFYRLSLHKGEKYIKVCEEIDIIKYYLDIQAKVFPDLFTYDIEIDTDVCEFLTLKLILQPFVENTIKYAFYGINHQGLVKIKVAQDSDYVIFSISDNGCGFDTKIFKELSEKKNGFGIRNVRERLALEYGDTANFSIDSSIGKGTNVKITIPKSL
ncbi:MAG: histidine kinase [Bacilli bacterium]|jgi:sensor histidine kinase YesM